MHGVVYVEFLIAFIPIFVFFLGMVQLALAYGCKLGVQRAANNAARAAVVVLDDDPRWYDCQARMSFPADVECTNDTRFSKLMDSVMERMGGGDAAASGVEVLEGLGMGSEDADPQPVTQGCRYRAVREAAVMSLIPFAPTVNQFSERDSVLQAMGSSEGLVSLSPALQRLAAAFIWGRMISLTFPDSPNGRNMKFAYGEGDMVRVRVTFPFKCNIPIVNRFLCESPAVWYGGEAGAGVEHAARIANAVQNGSLSTEAAGQLITNMGNAAAGNSLDSVNAGTAQQLQDRWQSARDRISQPHYDDVRNYSRGWNLMSAMLALQAGAVAGLVGSTPRLMLIPAEAELPVQAAGFDYAACEEDEGGGGEGGPSHS